MQRITGSWLVRYVIAGIVTTGFATCLLCDLPGHLSYDSVIQLLEGRTGAYAGWHPPAMSWLLGLFDAVVPGTALFVVVDAALFFGSLFSLVWLSRRVSWPGLVVAVALVSLPVVLVYQGIVWKDVLFANACVAGFTLLAWAAARWSEPRWRFALLAAAFLFLCLAALARQNGILALAAGGAATGWIAARFEAPRLSFFLRYGAGALVFSALVLTSANVALGTRLVSGSAPAKQFRLLALYDITGFAAWDRAIPLAVLHERAPALEQAIRGDGARLYSPERNDPLAASARLQSALDAVPADAVRQQWFALIAAYPGRYLKIRTEVFRWIFLTPDVAVCLPYLTGVSGPAEEMGDLGLKPREDARDDALAAYADAFLGTPVFSHLFYALLSLAALVLLLRRQEPQDIAIAALPASAILFTASFFAIGIACDYRYLYALDLAALTAVFYIALDWRAFLQRFARRG